MTDPSTAGSYTRPDGDPPRLGSDLPLGKTPAGQKSRRTAAGSCSSTGPQLDEQELDAIGAAEERPAGLCGTVRPGTLGYQQCWRLPPGHRPPHISQDQQAWISSHDTDDRSGTN